MSILYAVTERRTMTVLRIFKTESEAEEFMHLIGHITYIMRIGH